MKPAKKNEPVFLSREIYSEEAVSLAAAVFEGRLLVRTSKAPGGLLVTVSGSEHAAKEFCNEVLNQQCRVDLGRKNSRLASIITTKALLSAAGENPAARTAKK